MTPFPQRLREVRTLRGKKLKEAAACLEIQVRSYQAYERGHREPGLPAHITLADFFNVSLDYLLGRADTDPNV